jgi:hypothetical protein
LISLEILTVTVFIDIAGSIDRHSFIDIAGSIDRHNFIDIAGSIDRHSFLFIMSYSNTGYN